MENLNEGKNRKPNYMAELAEIDAQSAIVAMEAKIGKLEEMAKAKETRLEMVSEDENLSELISKSAVKEMQKEIKEIRKMQEKLKKVYEKKNGKKPVEVVDEEEKMDEGNDPGEDTGVVHPDSMGNYLDEEDSIKEDKECDSCGVMHEGSCGSSYEEDDTTSIKEATIKVGDKVDVKPGVIDDFPSDQYVYNVNVEKINGDKLTVKDINNDEYEVSISDVEELNEEVSRFKKLAGL